MIHRSIPTSCLISCSLSCKQNTMTKTKSSHHRLGKMKKTPATTKRQQATLASFFQNAGGKRSAETLTTTQQCSNSPACTTISSKRPFLESPNEYARGNNNKNGSKFGSCPLCSNSFPLHKLESHASSCLGPTAARTTSRETSSSSSSTAILQKPCTALGPKLLMPTSEPIPGLFVYEAKSQLEKATSRKRLKQLIELYFYINNYSLYYILILV